MAVAVAEVARAAAKVMALMNFIIDVDEEKSVVVRGRLVVLSLDWTEDAVSEPCILSYILSSIPLSEERIFLEDGVF